MRYQKFFLTRFMTARCFIFVFLFFLNCVMTAEAGMILGKVCFHDIVIPAEEGEIKQDDFFTVLGGKLEKVTRYKISCTIKKAQCDKENCPHGELQLMRQQQSEPPCYDYKVFMSPDPKIKYHIICGKCETETPVINYGSLQWNIDFYHSGDKCQLSKPFLQK